LKTFDQQNAMKRISISELPAYLRYILSVVLTAAATFFKLRFFDLIGSQTPFLLYFGAIIVCSRWLGKGPAFFSLLMSLLATVYFFMAPYNAFAINFRQAVELFLFAMEAWLIISLSVALIKSTKKNLAQMKLFEAIMAKSSDGIVVVNKEGKRTYCSPSVENVIGYTDEEYLHFPAWKLGHPDELDGIREQYSKLVERPGEGTVLLHRMKHKNGNWIWVESRVTNSLDVPYVEAMIANFNDVTARIETEGARKDFMGIVSHELKSPLTSMKSYGQILLKKIEAGDDTAVFSFASRMLQLTNRMAKLINDMLDVATINAGQLKLDVKGFDLNDLVYEIAHSLQQTTENHQLVMDLCEVYEVSADRERIGQVITNLIANAIKYSPKGGEINVASKMEGDTIKLSVSDHGIGIPKTDIDLIFDRLYRVGNSGTIKGMGFGLYICQQIIQLHGGKLGVHSQEGKGSTFSFELPYLKV
jgi:PAS domain S-box-containing protein